MKERRLCVFLLGVLVIIAGVVMVLQSRYDVSAWRELSKEGSPSSANISPPVAVEGLQPLSGIEIYNPTTLSDKINGKAELYLAAGFKQLETQRFGLARDNSRWMERYVYQMEGYRNAFAVYSAQRRSDIQPLRWTGHAYMASNGLFMVHGPFYVEIIAAEVSEEMSARAADLARTFIAAHEVTWDPMVELTFFPVQGRVANSRVLNAADTFGIAGFNWVYTCRYAESAHEAVAFISRRVSNDKAKQLAQLFIDQWRQYGGEDVALTDAYDGVQAVTILDNYELVWVQGNYLAGVHEATNLEFGLRLAVTLRRAILEGSRGR